MVAQKVAQYDSFLRELKKIAPNGNSNGSLK